MYLSLCSNACKNERIDSVQYMLRIGIPHKKGFQIAKEKSLLIPLFTFLI